MERSSCQLENFTVTQKKIKVRNGFSSGPTIMCRIIGIQTSQDAKFYARTAKFDETFNNEGKSFVVQFSVKHEQKIDCGGGYVKVSICGNPWPDIFGNDIVIYRYFQVLWILKRWKGRANTTSCLVRSCDAFRCNCSVAFCHHLCPTDVSKT